MINNELLTFVSDEKKQVIADSIWKDIHDKQPQLVGQQLPSAYIMGGNLEQVNLLQQLNLNVGIIIISLLLI